MGNSSFSSADSQISFSKAVTIFQFKIIEFSIKKVVCCDNDCSVKTTTNLSHINFTKKILLIILLLLSPPPQQSFPLVSSNIPCNFFLTKLNIKFHTKTTWNNKRNLGHTSSSDGETTTDQPSPSPTQTLLQHDQKQVGAATSVSGDGEKSTNSTKFRENNDSENGSTTTTNNNKT